MFYEYVCPDGHASTRRGGVEASTHPCPCGRTATRRAFNWVYIHGETVAKGPNPTDLAEFAADVEHQYERVDSRLGKVKRSNAAHAAITRARAKMLNNGDYTGEKAQQIENLEKQVMTTTK